MDRELQLDNITNEMTNRIRDIVGDKLHKIILYGSYSRGDFDEDSDIDIMVLADIDKSELPQYRKDINKIASRMGLHYDVLFSMAIKSKDDFYDKQDILPFYQNILREGIEVYVK